MLWLRMAATPVLVAAGMMASAAVFAQQPGGEEPRPKKGPFFEKKGPPFEKGGFGKGKVKGPGGRERGDSSLEGWVRMLAERMTDPHDTIRESARAALVAVGRPAIPVLQQLAESGDDARAVAARKVMEAIERGGPGPRGEARGFGGFGGSGGIGGVRGGPMPPGSRERGPGAEKKAPMPRPKGEGREERPADRSERGSRRPGEEGGPNLFQRITDRLNLTEKQREQLQDIRSSFQTKASELIEKVRSAQIEPADVRERMLKLSDEATKQIKEMLTEDQRKLFEEIAPRGRPLFLPFGGTGGPGGPGRFGPPGERGERPPTRP